MAPRTRGVARRFDWVSRPVEPDLDLSPGTGPRSGYVALVGRPNAGKSTLLNQLLDQKIAATTHKPQTTRKTIVGILHPPGAEILLLDTPGFHRAEGPLNRFMVGEARRAIEEADVVALLVEAREDGAITPGNERLIEEIEEIERRGRRVIVLINKIDRVAGKQALLPQIQRYQERLGERLAALVPISALKRRGLDRAVKEMAQALPVGPRYYEEDEVTDQSERAITAELIREKVVLETEQELPYATYVAVEAFDDERPERVHVLATIYVERESQKGIVIGRGGDRLKAIGQRARHEVEHFLRAPVYLELHVKLARGWSEDPRALARFG